MWLPYTTIKLRNLGNSTDIWGTFSYLDSLLKVLSGNPKSPFAAKAIPEREHLIFHIDIQYIKLRRYPHDQEIHLKQKEYKAYCKSQHAYYYFTDRDGVPYMNARNGHDIEIADYLKRMTHWRRVDIVLSSQTLRNRCWRREVTYFLEDTLGPEGGSRRRILSFRPRYFHDLIHYLALTPEVAYEFMLGRENFSDNVANDFVEYNHHTHHGVQSEDVEGSDESDSDGNNSGNGDSDDDGGETSHGGGYINDIDGSAPGVDHQSLIDEADWQRKVIEAINEAELEDALRLSAAEAVGSGYDEASEDELEKTDDEGSQDELEETDDEETV